MQLNHPSWNTCQRDQQWHVEMVEMRTAIPGDRVFHPVYSAARRGGNKRVEYVNIKSRYTYTCTLMNKGAYV